MFCEDCGNFTHKRKMFQGLLVCATCYETRSGKPFKKYAYPRIDYRKQHVGKKKLLHLKRR